MNFLFWRLYLLLVVSIATVIIVLTIFFNRTIENRALQDFARDARQVAGPITHAWQKHPSTWRESLRGLLDHVDFEAEVLTPSRFSELEAASEFLQAYGDASVYDSPENGQLVAVFPLPDSPNKLVVIDYGPEEDLLEFLNQNPEEDGNLVIVGFLAENQEQIYMLLFIVLSAFILYFPTQAMTRHIHNLSNVSRRLGAGELSVRADKGAPAPLDQLATTFNEMAAKLQQTVREQEVMASAISHELRTPLSKLRLALALLNKQPLPEGAVVLSEDMNRHIEDLDELSSKTLALSKLNHAGRLEEIEKIDLFRLLEERIEPFSSMPNRTISCRAEQLTVVEGNLFYLCLALDNLIVNALRHARSKVLIELAPTTNSQDGDGWVEIKVQDDGPGVPTERRSEVFIPFLRLDDSRNSDSGGHGLGLAITQQIIKLHNGHISVEDGSLGGANFKVLLPMVHRKAR